MTVTDHRTHPVRIAKHDFDWRHDGDEDRYEGLAVAAFAVSAVVLLCGLGIVLAVRWLS